MNQRKGMMMMMRTFVLPALFLLGVLTVNAQRIYYSEPDKDDLRSLKFEIMGKYGSNYLVYKNIRNRHFIAVYDADMKQKDKIELDFIPDRAINVDMFSTPEHSIVIYQFQKKNIVYCMGVKVDGEGKKIGEPLELDTTQVNMFSDNKIYSTIISDDKRKLMVFKMKNKQRDDFYIQTLLLSNNLMPIRRGAFPYSLENTRESIADFYLDNEGNFLFSHVSRPAQREYISEAKLVMLPVYEDSIRFFKLTLDKVFLDELRIKVDNSNGRYVLTSLYSKNRRGNVDGLFTAIVNKSFQGPDIEKAVEFSDEFRAMAKGEGSMRYAFNDYFLKHIIVKRDGGVLITGENTYGSSRGNNFNRWDNPWMWGNSFYPGQFWGWNPYNNWGFGGFGGFGGWNSPFGFGAQQTRYFADNIMIIALDKDANLQWNNVIAKSQFDDNTDNMLSYQIMNSGAELLFLYNEWSRRTPMLNAQSLDPNGRINKEPPLKSLDKGFEFMIRFGKQVSAREMLVPCTIRNSFSFARIEF